MNADVNQVWNWEWPFVGPTPIHEGLDSEMFDRDDYGYSETFVREAIQNSLDARLDPDRPVTVKFTFHSEAIGPRRVFLEQVMAHRREAKREIPGAWNNGQVDWLLVEDFNAKGLGGDLEKRESDFWGYWLNFGISNKDGSGIGGRGIGRVTFLIASRLQTVIGYTRRQADGSIAICGMCVLRAGARDGKYRSTHAYLAKEVCGNIYRLHRCVGFRSSIRDAFAFTGYDGEFSSGLGLAILYPHQELSPEGILAAAIENFAPAIMNGSLQLDVNGQILNSSTIGEIAREMQGAMNNGGIKDSVDRYLGLLEHALTEPRPHGISLPSAQKRDFELIKEGVDVEMLRRRIAAGGVAVMEISFLLERRGSFSEVSLRAVVAASPPGVRPIDRLFREGMCLPDVRTRSPGELDVIVLVNNAELARYLNFCEGKAHLDLLGSREINQKLKDHGYKPRVKHLVKSLPVELRALLAPDITAPDTGVFDAFFPKPTGRSGDPKPRGPVDPIPPPLPPAPRMFMVDELPDGFRVRGNPEFAGWPVNARIMVAYADGSRRPSWSQLDFKLNDLNIRYSGCRISTDRNIIRLLEFGPGAEVKVTGFDANRELDTSIRRIRSDAQAN